MLVFEEAILEKILEVNHWHPSLFSADFTMEDRRNSNEGALKRGGGELRTRKTLHRGLNDNSKE